MAAMAWRSSVQYRAMIERIQEIDILKGLYYPHIVALIDCKESTSHIHLVMKYCALSDLSYFIKKRDSLYNYKSTKNMIMKYPSFPESLTSILREVSACSRILRCNGGLPKYNNSLHIPKRVGSQIT